MPLTPLTSLIAISLISAQLYGYKGSKFLRFCQLHSSYFKNIYYFWELEWQIGIQK